MTDLILTPAKLSGAVTVPPSKSMAHRAVICAALSEGKSLLTNIEYSDDIIATIEAMRSLGASFNRKEAGLEVAGIDWEAETVNELEKDQSRTIDCNESGSTLRFLIPIATLFEGDTRFIGRGNLGTRPLEPYYQIFDRQGIAYTKQANQLHLTINGDLQPDLFELRGDVSSQFISGLLFALPLLKNDSKIVITTELESKGYIDLTLSMMQTFGIEVLNNDYRELIIKGNQRYQKQEYRIEGDYSQAAFFLCADALANQVVVQDLKPHSLQGDREIIAILERMGVEILSTPHALEGKPTGRLKAALIDGSQCPDIIPVVSLVAALSEGTTEIINAGRLRIKECDRLKAVTSELSKLGAVIFETADGLIIEGVEQLVGGVEVWSHKDHRIAMMLAIAATVCQEPIVLKDAECVSKSYPHFWEDYTMLGGNSHERCLGK
ncbi:MAG: 3-phosphoshikimate 1-carboxyvinyltransferase [Carnobacterium sp.]|uniref:3-phosphoshikimate 1-carboxyvinyltransferase n=2 Tax=Carnobacterium TaxID=2747 RepID=UPI0019136769|nr:3-phosphoshikimate 1-carboxyvinyltransferase [Carnobacterium sp. CS13]QQP71262.1 3-phosphoshikimate 1-carboxyvinyltransferase [Carnobacterium sp. CS13]